MQDKVEPIVVLPEARRAEVLAAFKEDAVATLALKATLENSVDDVIKAFLDGRRMSALSIVAAVLEGGLVGFDAVMRDESLTKIRAERNAFERAEACAKEAP